MLKSIAVEQTKQISEQTKQISQMAELLRCRMLSEQQNAERLHMDENEDDNGNHAISWTSLQISGDQSSIMPNVHQSEQEEKDIPAEPNEEVISWPDEWIKLSGKSLEEAFFAYYSLRLPELYAAIDRSGYDAKKKNNVKNSWSVIQKAVRYMRYFVIQEEILAPPLNGSPMDIAQWKRSLAAVARNAQEKAVEYLISSKLREKKTYSLSGNARIIANAPRPTNRVLVRDFLNNDLEADEEDAPILSLEEQLLLNIEQNAE